MTQENQQNHQPPEYASLIRELEQPENQPPAPPPSEKFRLSLRRELLDRYDTAGLSRQAVSRLWQFAGAVAGLVILAGALLFWTNLAGRPQPGSAPAAQEPVDPQADRPEAPVVATLEAAANPFDATATPETTGRVWLISAIQQARDSASDRVVVDVRVGMELIGEENAEFRLFYAAPDWNQRETGRVPMDSMTAVVPVIPRSLEEPGNIERVFSFMGRPEEMRQIVGTDRPVLVLQLAQTNDEGEVVELKILDMQTYGDYPLDLTATDEIVHRPGWDALGLNECAITEPVRDQPPDDPNADPFGEGLYYINEDRTLWLSAPPDGLWTAGGEKVAYIRPAGAELTVTGRRLDADPALGDAPPLLAENPCCYPTGFQVGALIFPTEGCWAVTVSTAESELELVVPVLPNPDPPAGGTCTTLEDAVRRSDAVIVGEVLSTSGDDRYAWQEVAVRRTLALPPGTSGIGDWISLLQDWSAEPPLQVGEQYVLFLQHAPWQILCPQETLFQVQGEQVAGIGADPLWPAGLLSDLAAQVEELR